MKTEETTTSGPDSSVKPAGDSLSQNGDGGPDQAAYELIAGHPFFKGMKARQLRTLAASALQVRFAANQVIFREGAPSNRFYLILKGKALLESENAEGSAVPIQILGPGDDLGWSWLFPPHYLHFSAVAVEPVEAIFFYGTRLRRDCEEDRVLGYEIMKRVAGVVVRRLEASQRYWSGLPLGGHRFRAS